MKKRIISLFAAIALIAFVTNAQEVTKTTFGVRAGINFQNINGKDYNGDKLTNSLIVGFNIGANVEIPIAQDFFLQPGLLFTTKGAKINDESPDTKINIGYIELPINFLYKPLLGNGHFMLGFGPYVAYGVTGDASEFKALDAGANILAGYEFASKLSFQLNAQLGLVKINSVSASGDMTSEKNTGFGFSLGYRF